MSSLSVVGTILLLVGAIVSTVGAALASFLGFTAGQPVVMVVAALLAIGAVFGFLAWRKAAAGQLGPAFRFGLTSALLPPLQVVQLVGAILVKVADNTPNAPGDGKVTSPKVRAKSP